MLRLRNHLLPLLRAAPSPLSSPAQHQHGARRLLSTSPAPFSLEAYLVAACGLGPDQARKASKQAFEEASKIARKPFADMSCSRLNSASNPDAVLALLSGVGLSRADIAAIVAADPLILRATVKNIGPRLLALRDRLGLSTPQIYRFLLVGSRAIFRCRDVFPKLEFLISFLGSFEKLLVAIKRSYMLLWADLDRVIKANIMQFRQCGLSFQDTVLMCSNCPSLLSVSPERVKDIVLRAEALGVPRTSRTFRYALAVACSISKEKIAARIEFLKSALGCSESEVAIAVSIKPNVLGISEARLLPKILFMLNEVGVQPQYIVERPALLGYSLEKRLVPRHRVMKLLQAAGLLSSDLGLYTISVMTDQTFRLKFIAPHKDSVPGLEDAYAAASTVGMPPGSPTLTS